MKGLRAILEESSDLEQLLGSRISVSNPTNHAIGKDATFLQFASFRVWKEAETVPTLLEFGSEMDVHSASGLGLTDQLSELLRSDPTAFNKAIDTYFPIQYAITGSRADAIQCLIDHGDDPNRDLKKVAYFGWEDDAVDQEYTPWKPIHMASLWGFNAKRVPVAECLADNGADLNAVSPLDGYRPLHLVAMPNRVDMIRFFVERGVDVDSRAGKVTTIQLSDDEGGPLKAGSECTALMVSAGEGFVEATECLLDVGADVNATDNRGQTALHFAAKRFWNGQPYDDVIALLLARGADKRARDADGKMPAV